MNPTRLLLSVWLLFGIARHNLYAYDRAAVSQYADTYWGDARSKVTQDNGMDKEGYNIVGSPNRKPDDYYEAFYTDCANFVSQCLISGGLNLAAGPMVTGRRWMSGIASNATIPYVDNLHAHLIGRKEWGHKKLISPDLSIPSVIKAGDVIIYGDYVHAVIVVEGSGVLSKVNSHTTDRYHRDWNYKYGTKTDQDSICHLYHFDEESPTVRIEDQESGGIVDRQIVSARNIYVYAGDTDIGSGIDKIEVRKGSELGPIVFSDATDYEFGDYNENGIISNARYSLRALTNGKYFIKVVDQAGNQTRVEFTVQSNTIHTVESFSPLYSGFAGISNIAPSTLENTHTFRFDSVGADLSGVTIDGPQRNLVSWDFNPPVSSTDVALGSLPTGTYQVKSWNAVGAETSTPFKIGELSVSISTPASSQQYLYTSLLEPGTFQVTLRVKAESPDGVKHLQSIEPTLFTLVADNIVEGNETFWDMPLPPFPQSAVAGGVDWFARAIDGAGNIRTNLFGLKLAAAAVPAYGDACVESCTQKVATDVVKSDFLGSPFLKNYAVYASTSGPYVYVPSGGRVGAEVVSQWVTQNPPSVFDMTMPLTVGTLRGTLRAWGKEDKSDLVEVPTGDYEVFWDLRAPDSPLPAGVDCGFSHTFHAPTVDLILCTRGTGENPILLQNKRYAEVESVYTRTSNVAVPICGILNDGSGNYSCAGHAAVVSPLFNQLTSFMGVALERQTQSHDQYGMTPSVPAGNNIYMPLGGYGEIVFSKVITAGNLSVTLATSRPPNGYAESPVNSTYKLTSDEALVFEGPARLKLKYDAENLTSAQVGKLKLLRVLDSALGKYDEFAASLNQTDKSISADIEGFSEFIVASPEHHDPHIVQSGLVNGSPELEFLAGVPTSVGQYNMESEIGRSVLSALKSANRLPAGNVYQVSAATDNFEPSGAIKMRYDSAVPAMLGAEEDSLAIYAFNEAGNLYRLPYMTLDKVNKVLTARVSSPDYSLYAVLASSIQVENVPSSVYPDVNSPETTIVFSGLTTSTADGTFISTVTAVSFSASDPQVPNMVTSGVEATNYILYPDSDTLEISAYTAPFILPEGVYPMLYFSVDKALNYELPKGATIYADGTPPETALSATGMVLVPGSSFYATISEAVIFNSSDPVVNGARSGVYRTLYLVDRDFSACGGLAQIVASIQNPVGTAGTCENPVYAGQFSLAPGSHTVQYLSVDNVWNVESPQTFYLSVLGRDILPPEAFLLVDGSTIASSGSADITTTTVIAITAFDTPSTNTVSGVQARYYLVDTSPSTCGEFDNVVATAPAGTCQNPVYSGEFSLEIGSHTVYYNAVDFAGNVADVKAAMFNVRPIDTTPPVSIVTLSGTSGNNNWFAGSVKARITATDEYPGSVSFYSLDGSSFTTYQTTVAVNSDGYHVLHYYSVDAAGNQEAEQTLEFKIDASAPAVSYLIMPAATAAGWNNSAAEVVFTGTDTISGVDYCLPSQPVSVASGSRTVVGYCADKAGNIAYSTAVIKIDVTAPTITAMVRGAVLEEGVSEDFAVANTVTLTSTDPQFNGLSSGIQAVRYSVDTAFSLLTASTYTSAFNLPLGVHTLYYAAVDNAGNISQVKSAPVSVTPHEAYYVSAISGSDFNNGLALRRAFATIGKALSMTNPGDSILVSTGVYHEALNVTKSSVTFRAIGDAVLDGDTNGDGARDLQTGFYMWSVPNIKIIGFTVKHYLSGIFADWADGIVISSCVVTDNAEGGIGVFDSPNAVVEWNTVMRNWRGIHLEIGIARYNVVAHTTDTGIMAGENQPTAYGTFVYNNTVYDTTYSGISIDSSYGHITVKNNIVVKQHSGVSVGAPAMPPNVDMDYNNVWGSTLNESSAPRGTHDISADPYFGNEATNDLRLEAGSPCIGAGENGSTIGYYQGPFLPATDRQPPVVSARINGQTVADGAAVSMTDADKVFLEATDDFSGVKDVLYTLNTPFSAAVATHYGGEFSLQLGTYTLYYTAIDNADRMAAVKSARLTVNSANYGQDATAPITTPFVNGVRISTGAPTYVRYGSTLTFTATDPIFNDVRSGVAFTTYTFTMYTPPDWAFLGAANYTEPLLATMEGQFTLYFRSRDNAGNWEQQRSRVIYVDGTPPVTAALVRGITVQSGAAVTIASSETVTLSASDPVSGLVSSGLGGIRYTIDVAYSVAASTAYTSQPISFSTGTHTLYYTASDGVGNQAAVKTAVLTVTSVALDTLAPVTRPYIDGVLVSSGTAPLYMRSGSQLTLVPTDMPATGYSSGVALTTYTVTQYISSAWVTIASGTYAGALVPQEGYYTLYFRSRDNAGNWESQKSRLVYVDGTAPDTSAQVRGVIVESGTSVTITSTDTVALAAQDPVSGYASSGLGRLMYTLDTAFSQAAAATYGGPISLAPGAHTLYYSATDAVGNLAAVKSLAATVLGSVASPVNIGGAPEVLFSAPVSSVTITQLPPDSPQGIAVLGEAATGGLQPVSNIYELGPDGDYPELTNVTFAYSPESLPAGVTESDLALYEHFDGTGWVRLPGQVLDTVNHRITAPITQIASLFAIFGPIPQTTLPIAPSSGPVGVPFSITGSGFGTYSSGITVVLIGGATAPISVWNDSTINGTIPGSLAAGEYAVSVKRGTSTITGVQPFTVAVPSLLSIAPSSGAIGVPFTIIGVGFGNYVAGYTKVLIGGVAAPVSLWTDTKIQGTVPGSLAAGDHDLVVRRELNGGVSASQPVQFKVLVPTLAAIVPSSGAIGVGYTLTGSGFGNYVANYTRVLIGGATAPVSLWTDTKIQGTVPGSLASGTYEVAVERELNGGVVRSETVSFTLVAPSIASIAPSSGAIGVPFTINGASFGNYVANYTKVLIGGATAPISLWTDTKIQGTVPGALVPGDHELLVTRELNGGVVTTQPVGFKVLSPEISALTPSSGAIGVPFTILGNGFGNYVANYTKVLIGGATAPVSLWTDTKIQGTVPGSLLAGDRELVIERALNGGVVRSAALAFSVIVPEIGSVTPSSGPIGLPFTILGSGFGNYVANYTKVLIGGATAPVSLWTDTKIQGSIPGALSPGEYELLVERALNGGVVRTQAAAFEVAAPVLGTVSPSTAAVMAPFTLTGYNFGNYVANYTKVLINGTTTSVSLWTDTKIQGKLPFLPAGQYPVQVQRVLNGGIAESAVAWINVEELAISSMTPASGAVGTVFNLYGTGFGSYDASLAHVTMGGAACAVSLWTDTKITGTVPAALGSGTHAVVASRGQALSNPLEYYIPGGYGPSAMARPGLAQPAREFRLGEVYVYPDPAKAGKVPTFHIEVGAADSVKIRVFTVAGQLAHEQTLTGSPQNAGGVYAYEYAWTGRIASSVYYYTIEAERSGKKLKAKGKFSVVR